MSIFYFGPREFAKKSIESIMQQKAEKEEKYGCIKIKQFYAK
jgi:hypothetical protein